MRLPWRALSAAATAAFAAMWPARAVAADAERVALDWDAPEGCPPREGVAREVNRLLGGAAGAEVLAARASITRDDGGFRVALSTEWRGVHGERAIAARSCEELADAIAIVLALTIEPSA